jgi:hemerythrin superfamily protein
VSLLAERRRVRPGLSAGQLAAEHGQLDALFQDVLADARCEDPAGLRSEWTRFERELATHMELEERTIFPGFAHEHPEEARALRDEHARIRAGLVEMGVDLDLHCLRADRVEAFVNLLRAHARREESLFYPWAARRGGES